MFKNPGDKIKGLAVANFFIDCLAAVIGGIVLICDDYGWVGFVTIVGGLFIAYVTALLLYGFGELIENSSYLKPKEKEPEILPHFNKSATQPSVQQQPKAVTPQQTTTSTNAKNESEPHEGPVHPIVSSTDDNMIICPKCGCSQVSNRRVCWKCGAKFE